MSWAGLTSSQLRLCPGSTPQSLEQEVVGHWSHSKLRQVRGPRHLGLGTLASGQSYLVSPSWLLSLCWKQPPSGSILLHLAFLPPDLSQSVNQNPVQPSLASSGKVLFLVSRAHSPPRKACWPFSWMHLSTTKSLVVCRNEQRLQVLEDVGKLLYKNSWAMQGILQFIKPFHMHVYYLVLYEPEKQLANTDHLRKGTEIWVPPSILLLTLSEFTSSCLAFISSLIKEENSLLQSKLLCFTMLGSAMHIEYHGVGPLETGLRWNSYACCEDLNDTWCASTRPGRQ